MIKVSDIDVWGFEHAIRGMRNPKNSWHRSDSEWCKAGCEDCALVLNDSEPVECVRNGESNDDYHFCIGKEDMKLMRNLYKGGTEHRKYARQIMVSMDITAPLYWWKEFDTYKVGTVANSCSTMHKIHDKEFEIDDFSIEHLFNNSDKHHFHECACFDGEYTYTAREMISDVVIPVLNTYRDLFITTKDKLYWWQMIQLLPSSYNQKRTVTFSYENVFTMIKQRSGHKLDEWREFVEILKSLPYVEVIIND